MKLTSLFIIPRIWELLKMSSYSNFLDHINSIKKHEPRNICSEIQSNAFNGKALALHKDLSALFRFATAENPSHAVGDFAQKVYKHCISCNVERFTEGNWPPSSSSVGDLCFCNSCKGIGVDLSYKYRKSEIFWNCFKSYVDSVG